MYELTREWSGGVTQSETARNLAAGAVASMVSQTIMTPVDVISQRLMVRPPPAALNE